MAGRACHSRHSPTIPRHGNTLNPATVTIVTPPANGSAVVNPATGAVTYTPNPGFVGPTNTFTYTVRDNLGVVSNTATVTVTVTPPSTETLAVTRAEFRVGGAEWRIEGTTTARVAETIQIFNSDDGPADGTTGLVGTATVDRRRQMEPADDERSGNQRAC